MVGGPLQRPPFRIDQQALVLATSEFDYSLTTEELDTASREPADVSGLTLR